MANPNYDQLLSTTLEKFNTKLEDNVFTKTPLLWFLTDKNQVRKVGGGRKIVEQLLYGEGESTTYSEWEPIVINPQEGITAAEYPWRLSSATIAISGLQELQNSGEEEIIDLLEAKVKQAEMTKRAAHNRMAFSDGTGNSGKDWLGLGALIGDHEVGPEVVGGIDCTEEEGEFWRSYVADKTGDEEDVEDWLEAEMRTAYNSASDGSDVVDALFTTQHIFEIYESLLTPNVRYQDTRSASLGFTNLMFKGVPIYWDRDCPAGEIFGVNSKYVRLVGHKNRWFKQTPFSSPLDQGSTTGQAELVDARYATILSAGNMTISNRRRQFRITGVDQEGD